MCLYLWNSNFVLIHLCYYYCFVHQAWVPRNPPGNNPMPGLVCGWLCWELKILRKCHQPLCMYSLDSSLNKELTWISVIVDLNLKMDGSIARIFHHNKGEGKNKMDAFDSFVAGVFPPKTWCFVNSIQLWRPNFKAGTLTLSLNVCHWIWEFGFLLEKFQYSIFAQETPC